MEKSKLVDELAQRTGVPTSGVEAVLKALRALPLERILALLRPQGPAPQPPSGSLDVESLIARAEKHPLGLEFLLNGDLSAVAITFQTHAFTVDAARLHLKERGASFGPDAGAARAGGD